MYRSAVVFGLYLSFAIAVGAACSSGSPQVPGDDAFVPPSTGGSTSNTGGTGTATGGTGTATGGTGTATGGTGTATGGTGTGGTTAMAGRSATGGTTAAGGSAGRASATGGTGTATGGTGTATGGTGTATGGTGTATGGTGTATGGTGTGTGGTTGAAGSPGGAACDTTWMVGNDGFVRMPAKGGACWSGYAFAGGDTSSMVTFPGGGKDFSKSMGKLEITGTVGSATADNMYAGNVYFGFNVGQPAGASTSGMVTPTGTSLTVTCTGCATPKMRVQLVAGSSTWCADLPSGTAVPYASFTAECYNTPPGAAYAKQPIASIQISILGAVVGAMFDWTLASVTEQ